MTPTEAAVSPKTDGESTFVMPADPLAPPTLGEPNFPYDASVAQEPKVALRPTISPETI
jgi:hypothetical protein